MSASAFRLCLFAAASCAALLDAMGAWAKVPDDFAGTWVLASGKLGAKCRVLLRPEKSDKGNFFLGMPAGCRHSMPKVESIGRWGAPDDTHLTLDDPAGTPVLSFTGAGKAFMAISGDDSFTLQKTESAGRPAAGISPVETKQAAEAVATVQPLAPPKKAKPAALDSEAVANLPGRYAVMREKRDTGCMLTLDKTRSKGADRAQLAPGCRDQGIVIFDPASWQIIKGELVLTARAGHKARLLGAGDGAWQKDQKDGGKPLGLKKL